MADADMHVKLYILSANVRAGTASRAAQLLLL